MKKQNISSKQIISGTTKYLYQRLDNSFGIPFDMKQAKEFGLSQFNTWTTGSKAGFVSEGSVIMELFNNKEIGDSVKNLVYYNESDHKITKLIEFINSKRFLTYTINEEKLYMFIPQSLMEKPFQYPREFLDYDYSLVQLTHYNPIPEERVSRILSPAEVKMLKAGTFELFDKDEFIFLDGDLIPSDEYIKDEDNTKSKNLQYTIKLENQKLVVSNVGYRLIVNRNQSLNYFSSLLFQAMISYHKYQICEKEEDKVELEKEFLGKIHSFRMAINKRVFSKEFKNHITVSLKGYSGVVLTGNVGINEIEIPKHVADKFNLTIGSQVIVYRDPVQNVFVCLTVVGFTRNEIRMNPITILITDGDCDGDKIQVIPVDVLFDELSNFLSVGELEDIRKELENIKPSNLLSSDSQFFPLTKCYL